MQQDKEAQMFEVSKQPELVETANAIYEYCDAFSVVGANTGPNGTTVHVQFARDVAEAPRAGELSAESVRITRRMCATISIPEYVAVSLVNAINATITGQNKG